MATSSAVPRPTRAPSLQTKRPSLSEIKSTGNGLPNRYIVHAVEGWGKTSFGAHFPKPIFIESRGETGLETLIDAGQLPQTPHFPEFTTWHDITGAVETLLVEEHDHKTLVIDTGNGVERLCHEYVCERDYSGEWGDKGFGSYQKGPEVALADWRGLLSQLDRLRLEKRMTIVILLHTKIAKFNNPEAPDYDRYQPDVDKRTWSLTGKWADVVLFGNFDSTVSGVRENKRTGEKKGKGEGGQQRVLYTVRHAAYDAKNRIGLAPEIEMGNSPTEGWMNFKAAVLAGRKLVAEPEVANA